MTEFINRLKRETELRKTIIKSILLEDCDDVNKIFGDIKDYESIELLFKAVDGYVYDIMKCITKKKDTYICFGYWNDGC